MISLFYDILCYFDVTISANNTMLVSLYVSVEYKIISFITCAKTASINQTTNSSLLVLIICELKLFH